LQAAAGSRLDPVRVPLLLVTDQEGGLVRRLPGAPAASEKRVGLAADPGAAARAAGAGAAVNLRRAGLNGDLAPVLDVFRSAGDFIDRFGRSYSDRPGKVARLGADFITAVQGGGVAAAAKHFPGLGAAAAGQDTDAGPVTLRQGAAVIRAVDERPYRAAVAAGAKLVMVSWARYPALDTRYPAGLSPVIVGGELRRRVGFSGVTITDALEAGALRPFGPIRARATLAAAAGMDLLLCSAQATSEGTQAIGALQAGYRTGQLPRPAFRAAVRRILALRATLPR
jgi:beta-N-acetylhexosaminidase